jgi:hypothetical protein
MTHLEDDEIELMGQIANLDYEASLEDPVLHALSRKGLVLITSGKRVIITERGIDWLDDNGWACGGVCDSDWRKL